MGRKKSFLVTVTALVLIAAGVYYFFINPPAMAAQLSIDHGNVEIGRSGSWSPARNGMMLREGDSVRTANDSMASVIFFGSAVNRLDENTEIRITRLYDRETTNITLFQVSGRTWSRILGLSGIDSYIVETPNAAVAVTGTAFSVSVGSAGTGVSVARGTVDATAYETLPDGGRKTIQKTEITENSSATISSTIDLVPLHPDRWFSENLILDEQFLLDAKNRVLWKMAPIEPVLARRLGTDKAGLERAIEGIMRGDIKLPRETEDRIAGMLRKPENIVELADTNQVYSDIETLRETMEAPAAPSQPNITEFETPSLKPSGETGPSMEPNIPESPLPEENISLEVGEMDALVSGLELENTTVIDIRDF